MAENFEPFQTLFKNRFEAAVILTGALAKGVGKIAVEAMDYSQTSLKSNADLAKKLVAVKSFDEAMQVQTEHAKAACEASLAKAKKLGELFADLSKDAMKSVVANGGTASAPVKVPSVGKMARSAE